MIREGESNEQPTQSSTGVKPIVKNTTRWADIKDTTDPYTDKGIVVTRVGNTEEQFGNPFIGSKRRDKQGNLVESKVDNITVFNTIDEADQAYRDWLMRKQSMSYVFKNDLDKIDNLIGSLKVIDNQHPVLFKKYLSKEISAETLIIINKIQRFFGYWTKNLKTCIVWQEEKNKLQKLTPFVDYQDKYKGMLIEQFKS